MSAHQKKISVCVCVCLFVEVGGVSVFLWGGGAGGVCW